MVGREAVRSMGGLLGSFEKIRIGDPLLQCLAPRISRSMATVTSLPDHPPNLSAPPSPISSMEASPQDHVLTTLYSWPALEPLRFAPYPTKHLHLPLRRDILHRAVIYEGDKKRQGTASTKWRGDVRGSSKKIRPQKGTGHARLGDKKSPMLRGGGVAHGPHPRDFSTGLQRKVYDLAWRTALSYRYRRGQLVVVDGKMRLQRGETQEVLQDIFQGNKWGGEHGRSMLVTTARRERFFREMGQVTRHGIVKDIFDVDVKDLLKTARVVIEKSALDILLMAHSCDLGVKTSLQAAIQSVQDDQMLAVDSAYMAGDEAEDEDEDEDEEGEDEDVDEDEREDEEDDEPLSEDELKEWEDKKIREEGDKD